jgi:hypothetical protein
VKALVRHAAIAIAASVAFDAERGPEEVPAMGKVFGADPKGGREPKGLIRGPT